MEGQVFKNTIKFKKQGQQVRLPSLSYQIIYDGFLHLNHFIIFKKL